MDLSLTPSAMAWKQRAARSQLPTLQGVRCDGSHMHQLQLEGGLGAHLETTWADQAGLEC